MGTNCTTSATIYVEIGKCPLRSTPGLILKMIRTPVHRNRATHGVRLLLFHSLVKVIPRGQWPQIQILSRKLFHTPSISLYLKTSTVHRVP